MKSNLLLKRFLTQYFDPGLDLRIQAFNLLGFAGISAGIVTSILALFTDAGFLNILLNLSGSLVGLFCLHYVSRTKKYDLGFLLVVVIVFLLLFPFLFFNIGGYQSGMPAFFIFAIVFTTIMLEGKKRILFTAFELIIYGACFWVAFRHPQTVTPFETPYDAMLDTMMGTLIVAMILVLVVLLYMRIHGNHEKQLESLDQLKTEFFQNMNHDMKTPLTIIASDIGNAEDLLDYEVDKETIREYLLHAQEEIQHLARQVEHSLTLAAANEWRRYMSTFDYGELLRSNSQGFRGVMERSGNRLTLDIPTAFPLIHGNRDMLKQVLNNLLFNASKHTKNSEIKVSLRHLGEHLETTISDLGEGIHENILRQIWERGVSGDGTTGYGMHISKTIVEMHGGEISIDSRVGEGTTIRFTLPINAS